MKLPEDFIKEMQRVLANDYDVYETALQSPPPVSVRVNNKLLLVPSAEKVAWCEQGYYLPERPLFTADPLFHAGAYYVQEAASMFLHFMLEKYVSKSVCVLDLSAAPGGKSTLISQFLDENGFLVSNEIVRSRAFILAENMIKWGNPNCLVSNNAPKDFAKLPAFFDLLVVDAPCSGEGMFRKDAGAISEWSEQNVQICVARQKDILADAWDALKTDGILLYSTCTHNRRENEENVQWIAEELGAEILMPDTSQFPEITVSESGFRFYPHKTRGEGFFMAALRKTSEAPKLRKPNKKQKRKSESSTKPLEPLKNQLHNPENWDLLIVNDLVVAVEKKHAESVAQLRETLSVMHFGVTLATIKGKNRVPHISLALSKKLNAARINHVELDKENAIRYLRREALYLPEAASGYLLILYKGLPLGWVKNMGNRSNNLYPNEWRIRMEIKE